MYSNLKTALGRKNISIKQYANFLAVNEKTVQNKLRGITEFTLSEVNKTLEFMFPEYTLSYLFQFDDQKGA